MSETWPGWIRAVWPSSNLVLIRNENMNKELRVSTDQITGRIVLNVHCQVTETQGSPAKVVID